MFVVGNAVQIRNNDMEFGSCALPGKMLLVRIIKNHKIDAYFR